MTSFSFFNVSEDPFSSVMFDKADRADSSVDIEIHRVANSMGEELVEIYVLQGGPDGTTNVTRKIGNLSPNTIPSLLTVASSYNRVIRKSQYSSNLIKPVPWVLGNKVLTSLAFVF